MLNTINKSGRPFCGMADVIYGTCVQGLGLDLRSVLSSGYLRTTTTMMKVKMNLVMKILKTTTMMMTMATAGECVSESPEEEPGRRRSYHRTVERMSAWWEDHWTDPSIDNDRRIKLVLGWVHVFLRINLVYFESQKSYVQEIYMDWQFVQTYYSFFIIFKINTNSQYILPLLEMIRPQIYWRSTAIHQSLTRPNLETFININLFFKKINK